MNISLTTVRAAFKQHRVRYAESPSSAWPIDPHVKLWETAHRAFHEESHEHFGEVYNQLRSRWQVFRGAKSSHWTAQQIHSNLCGCDIKYRKLRLSDLAPANERDLWELLNEIAGVKTLKSGPSVVAISKFLHFWNPKLFVIVDQGIMWSWVFAHQWLWDEVERERDGLWNRIGLSNDLKVGANCDLLSYLAILLWAGRVMRENATILAGFKEYIVPFVMKSSLSEEIISYEAVALEWFLLGVVELPAPGIT